ncbi:MAG TPA: energy transducer TonB [Pyrinomonadaceae bacterium]|nr:energy transducer TonB [Pyrinomonadaceae bacterium]
MKGIPLGRVGRAASKILCALACVVAFASILRAQEVQQTQEQTQASAAAAAAPATTEPEPDAVQRRIARARSLAAVGKLGAAASELEALRTTSADKSVRDVASILLMWIYVEMPDYTKAGALLDETFKAHTTDAQPLDRTYFSLAGQTINSVRTHLERYRTFGINVSDAELPGEAASDLEQLRRLLERVIEQARAVRDRDLSRDRNAKSPDAMALLEDAATVRLRLARGENEREQWQREVADARQRLVASETRVASISGLPPAVGAPVSASVPPGRTPATNTSNTTAAAAPAEKSANNNSKPAQKQTVAAPKQKQTQTPAVTTEEKSAQGGTTVAVGALSALATQKVSPSYPAIAKTARISGIVTVYLVVDEKGVVESVLRTEGPMQLQSAAADAARRWKFRPTLVDGKPVRVSGFLSFNFAL